MKIEYITITEGIMPAPFPQPREGESVNNPPSGFPMFFCGRKPRVVTSDPWGFLKHIISSELPCFLENRAQAYLEQAFDFFQAAKNPQLGSKPLLYYYSFLNLVKVALLARKVLIPTVVKHGISDPKLNDRQRLHFSGQVVQFPAKASNHAEVFPEFVALLGGDASRPRKVLVVDALSQIPCIHRTYVRVTKKYTLLMPIKEVILLRNESEVWARLILDSRDRDVKLTFKRIKGKREFETKLHRTVAKKNEIWLETDPVPGVKRGVDSAIQTLTSVLRKLCLTAILTASGYRYYFWIGEKRKALPPLSAGYAALFYLGSVTRYKPDVFDKILGGGYAWLVDELISTFPVQFIYNLASELAGVDVVRPFAAIE